MIILWLHIIINLIGLVGLIAGTFKLIISKNRDGYADKLSTTTLLEWGWLLYVMGVIFGGIWARILYGRFWIWDIKEIMSLSTILFYLITIIWKIEKKSLRIKKILAVIGLVNAIATLLIPRFVISYHFF